MEALEIHRKRIVILLLAGGFISILNQTLMITAIPPIMNEMGVSANSAQWLTTVFMFVNGIMVPISAFLIERFTTRQLFLTAMSIFAVGTLIAGVAPNFPFLLLGRVVQSFGAGVMLPLMTTVFLMIFPVQKRGAAMGLIGLVMSFAPAIGPTLSGWVTSNYSWRILFYIIFPIAVIDILLASFALVNVTKVTKTNVDIWSIFLSIIGFGGLLYGFTSAGNYGWTNVMTIVSITIGVVMILLFILRQLRLKHPMLEFRVFTYSVFPFAVVIGGIGFMGLIGVETIIPLYMQDMRDFTAFEAGLALLPGALITGLLSPIIGKIFDKIGARVLVITGSVIVLITTFGFLFLDLTTSFAYITIVYFVRMIGFAMISMPVQTAALNQLPAKLIPHGAAMDNTMRMIAASVGTAILVTVMTTSATIAERNVPVLDANIFGVKMAFAVVEILSLIGLLLSFFIKGKQTNLKTE